MLFLHTTAPNPAFPGRFPTTRPSLRKCIPFAASLLIFLAFASPAIAAPKILVEQPAKTPPDVGEGVAFGEQALAPLAAARTLMIKNAGDGMLSVADVLIVGDDASDFSVNTAGMRTDIPAGSYGATFTVIFSPGAAGAKTALLRVLSNDPTQGTLDIILAGAGIAAPEIVIESAPGTPVAPRVLSWGDGTYGQRDIPDSAHSGVIAISAGGAHSLALKNDGSVIAWGYNGSGQTTVPLAAQSGVIAIAAGATHSVALKNDGRVIAWGWNGHGETTIPMEAQSGVIAIAAGVSYTVALKADGRVIAWGLNVRGQTTVPLAAQSDVIAIAAGHMSALALKKDGSVVAWGDSSLTGSMPVAARSGVATMAVGADHAVVVKTDGSIVGWGSRFMALPLSPQSGVAAASCGILHTMLLRKDGSVQSWGHGFMFSRPPSGITSIASGAYHILALSSLPFGYQAIGTRGTPRSFAIKNIGSAALDIAGLSLIGGDVSDFEVNTSGLLAGLPVGSGQTSFSVTFTPRSPGPRSATLRVLSNDADEGVFDIVLTGTGASSPLDAWKQTAFGANADNASVAGNAADPDGDGVPNLLEYATRSDPAAPNPPAFGQPESVLLPGDIPARQLRFPYRASTADLRYIVERSADLAAWAEIYRYDLGAGQITEAGVTAEEDAATETDVLTDPATGPGLFWRLRVEQP